MFMLPYMHGLVDVLLIFTPSTTSTCTCSLSMHFVIPFARTDAYQYSFLYIPSAINYGIRDLTQSLVELDNLTPLPMHMCTCIITRVLIASYF